MFLSTVQQKQKFKIKFNIECNRSPLDSIETADPNQEIRVMHPSILQLIALLLVLHHNCCCNARGPVENTRRRFHSRWRWPGNRYHVEPRRSAAKGKNTGKSTASDGNWNTTSTTKKPCVCRPVLSTPAISSPATLLHICYTTPGRHVGGAVWRWR